MKTFSVVAELLPGDGRTDRHVAELMGSYLEVHSLSLENGLPTPKVINSHSTVGNVPGNKCFHSFNIVTREPLARRLESGKSHLKFHVLRTRVILLVADTRRWTLQNIARVGLQWNRNI